MAKDTLPKKKRYWRGKTHVFFPSKNPRFEKYVKELVFKQANVVLNHFFLCVTLWRFWTSERKNRTLWNFGRSLRRNAQLHPTSNLNCKKKIPTNMNFILFFFSVVSVFGQPRWSNFGWRQNWVGLFCHPQHPSRQFSGVYSVARKLRTPTQSNRQTDRRTDRQTNKADPTYSEKNLWVPSSFSLFFPRDSIAFPDLHKNRKERQAHFRWRLWIHRKFSFSINFAVFKACGAGTKPFLSWRYRVFSVCTVFAELWKFCFPTSFGLKVLPRWDWACV